MNKSEVEAMSQVELRAAAKKAGIKYGRMSQMQIREALVAHKPTAEKKEKGERKQQTGTKMESALAIMGENKGKTRKEIINLFQTKAKLTKAGAATYYSLCQKKLLAK